MTAEATGTSSRLQRGGAAGLFVALLAALFALVPIQASAQSISGQATIGAQATGDSSQIAGGMQLLATDIGVAGAGTVWLKLRLPGVLAEHDELVVNIHGSVRSEANFLATTRGQSLESVLHTQVFLVSELEPGATGVVDLPLHINAAPNGRPNNEQGDPSGQNTTEETKPAVPVAQLAAEGVYPVTIELRTQSQQVVARIGTHIVHLPETNNTTRPAPIETARLNVLFTADLTDDRTGEEQPSVLTSDWLDVLNRHLTVPVLVSITPEALADTANAVPALAESSPRQVETERDQGAADAVQQRLVREAYYPVDLAALAAAGLDNEIDQLFGLGEQSLERYGFLAPANLWVGKETTSAQELAVRVGRGVLYTILPAAVLSANPITGAPATDNPTPGNQPSAPNDQISTNTSDGQIAPFDTPIREPVRVVFSDTSSNVTNIVVRSLVINQLAEIHPTDTPGAAAQRLLAHLAVIAFGGVAGGATSETAEARLNQSEVVVVDLTATDHSPQLTDMILSALDQLTLVRPLTADQALSKLQETDERTQPQTLYLQTQRPAELSTQVPDGYFDARLQLDSYRSMIRDEDSAIYEEMAQELLATLSTDITPSQQQAQWQRTSNFVKLELNQLEANSSSSIRLTSRSAQVPFSFQNSGSIPLRVEIRLLSDKLTVEDFDDGESTTLVLQPGVTTREFGLRTLGSGAFLVNMELRSPDGNLLLGRTPIVMQSTAPTWAGLLLATGATAFLLMWWVVDSRRRRASIAR